MIRIASIRCYRCLTERAGSLFTGTGRFGLTTLTARSARVASFTTTGTSWTRCRKGRGGCFPVKDEEDDDDKDDDQNTKKQHSITGGDIYGGTLSPSATCPHTPFFYGVEAKKHILLPWSRSENSPLSIGVEAKTHPPLPWRHYVCSTNPSL